MYALRGNLSSFWKPVIGLFLCRITYACPITMFRNFDALVKFSTGNNSAYTGEIYYGETGRPY
jgi:hypothetical protein